MGLGDLDLMDSGETIQTVSDDSNNIWKQIQTYVQIWASAIGVFINLVALYTVGKKRQLQTTNYYLINLMVCNIALLLLNFIKKFSFVNETDAQCKTFPYLQQVVQSVIVLNLLALTVHWYNTCRLNHPKQFLEQGRIIIAFIWLFSFLCAIPFSYFNVLNKTKIPGLSKSIELSQCHQTMPKYVLGVWTMVFFVIPMILILILYLKTMRNIRESINAAGYSTDRDAVYVHLKQIESRKKAVTFILLAVGTLFVAKFPENVYYTLVSWGIIKVSDDPWTSFYLASFYIYTIVSAILFMMTSMKANMLSRLEFNEKIDSGQPQEIQSLTNTEENSRL